MGYGIEGTDGSSCAAVRQTRRGRCHAACEFAACPPFNLYSSQPSNTARHGLVRRRNLGLESPSVVSSVESVFRPDTRKRLRPFFVSYGEERCGDRPPPRAIAILNNCYLKIIEFGANILALNQEGSTNADPETRYR
jgi:hypothetical protein